MITPEIRPYHNDPEKMWLVCGRYRIAFDVVGNELLSTIKLKNACEQMIELMMTTLMNHPKPGAPR